MLIEVLSNSRANDVQMTVFAGTNQHCVNNKIVPIRQVYISARKTNALQFVARSARFMR